MLAIKCFKWTWVKKRHKDSLTIKQLTKPNLAPVFVHNFNIKQKNSIYIVIISFEFWFSCKSFIFTFHWKKCHRDATIVFFCSSFQSVLFIGFWLQNRIKNFSQNIPWNMHAYWLQLLSFWLCMNFLIQVVQ